MNIVHHFQEKVASSKEEFDASFLAFIDFKYENGEIPQEKYDEIKLSMKSWDVEKVILASISIEAINNTIMFYWSMVVVWMIMYYAPDSKVKATLYAYILAKVPKLIYSYAIADKLDINNKTAFSIGTTLPFWKFVVPVIWLWDDRELVKKMTWYFKDKTEVALYNPVIQSTMRLFH